MSTDRQTFDGRNAFFTLLLGNLNSIPYLINLLLFSGLDERTLALRFSLLFDDL